MSQVAGENTQVIIHVNIILLPRPVRSQVACGDTQGLSAPTHSSTTPTCEKSGSMRRHLLVICTLAFIIPRLSKSFLSTRASQSGDIQDDDSRLFLIIFLRFFLQILFVIQEQSRNVTRKEPILPSRNNQTRQRERHHGCCWSCLVGQVKFWLERN